MGAHWKNQFSWPNIFKRGTRDQILLEVVKTAKQITLKLLFKVKGLFLIPDNLTLDLGTLSVLKFQILMFIFFAIVFSMPHAMVFKLKA